MADVRIGITIRTDTGTYQRISEEVLTLPGTDLTIHDDLLVYPDRRVESFQVYVDSSGWKLGAEYEAVASENLNLAYAQVPNPIDLSSPSGDMPSLSVNAEHDHDGNRMLVSGTNQPRDLRAGGTYFAGDGPNDTIVGFGSNAEPVSEGQYGGFPLFALCRQSIFAFEPAPANTEDVAFNQRVPLSTERGCVGRYAFTTVDNLIAFASRDGVYLIDGSVSFDSLSEPISSGTFVKAFAGCLGAGTALGTLNNANIDRVEIWVASGVLTFVYSPRHGRWHILDRARSYFHDYRGTLYGVSKRTEEGDGDDEPAGQPDGLLYDEAARNDELVTWGLLTAPLYITPPGVSIRVFRLALRQEFMMEDARFTVKDYNDQGQVYQLQTGELLAAEHPNVFNLYSGQARHPFVELDGEGYPGQSLVSFELEYHVRQPHRKRQTIHKVGNPLGDDPSPWGWDCEDGITYQFNEPPVLNLWDVLLTQGGPPTLNLWDLWLAYRGLTAPELHLWDVDLEGEPSTNTAPELHLWDVDLEGEPGPSGETSPSLALWDVNLGDDSPGFIEPPILTSDPDPVVLEANDQEQYWLLYVTSPSATGIDTVTIEFDSTGRPTRTIRFPFYIIVNGKLRSSENYALIGGQYIAYQRVPDHRIYTIDARQAALDLGITNGFPELRIAVAYAPRTNEDGQVYTCDATVMRDFNGAQSTGSINVTIQL